MATYLKQGLGQEEVDEADAKVRAQVEAIRMKFGGAGMRRYANCPKNSTAGTPIVFGFPRLRSRWLCQK